MICLIQLQAAIGFGIFIVMLLLFLFCVLLPILFVVFLKHIKNSRVNKNAPKKTSLVEYLDAGFKAFLVVIVISFGLLFLILWAMKDVVFM